ncbi:MAG: hypothetical protein WBC33_05350 [Conexibacter sp.]
MASAWRHVQVELEGSAGLECDPPPGRILLVGPSHTFLQLAETIDAAFARWDVAHLHAFELADGRLVGLPDEQPRTGGRPWLDHATLAVTREVEPGEELIYTFDLSVGWRHRCRVLEGAVDPLAEYGSEPARPAIVFGWGWIPDQYGRTSAAERDLP